MSAISSYLNFEAIIAMHEVAESIAWQKRKPEKQVSKGVKVNHTKRKKANSIKNKSRRSNRK